MATRKPAPPKKKKPSPKPADGPAPAKARVKPPKRPTPRAPKAPKPPKPEPGVYVNPDSVPPVDESTLPPEVQLRLKMERAAAAILARIPKDELLDYLASDVYVLSSQAFKIRTKAGGPLVPFVFNPIQTSYLRDIRSSHAVIGMVDRFQGIRDVIVKPRQLGFSTFIAALFFADGLLNPGRNTLVLTHLNTVSQLLLDTYRLFCEALPADIKETVRLRRASSLHIELEFLGPDGKPDPERLPASSFRVATAEGLDVRGVTIHNLHASEAAFYSCWADVVNGVLQAVPDSGNVVLESTANGMNHFYQIVEGWLAGDRSWRVIFYAWFQHPEYRLPWVEADQPPITAEERALMAEHGLDLDQLAWRRKKMGTMGSPTRFRQEYPETLLGAFIASGRPVFDQEVCQRNHALAAKFERDTPPLVPLDGISVVAPPRRGGLYLVIGDPAEGIDSGEESSLDSEIGGTDFSAGGVLDVANLVVVAWVHGRFPPEEFARKLAWLGERYDATIAVERNNHGHAVLLQLELSGYPQLYRHLEYDQAGQTYLKLGFPMNLATKPLVVDALDAAIRRDALRCASPRFWMECFAFVRDKKGKFGAMAGRHDDRVMAMAIGVYLATLGSSQWGVGGVLVGADPSGLPPIGGFEGHQARLAAEPHVAHAVEPDTAQPPAPRGLHLHRPAASQVALPVAASPHAGSAVGLAPQPAGNAEGFLSMFRDARATALGAVGPSAACGSTDRAASGLTDWTPRCGLCLHRPEGQSRCIPRGWSCRDEDPPCDLFLPRESGEGYDES